MKHLLILLLLLIGCEGPNTNYSRIMRSTSPSGEIIYYDPVLQIYCQPSVNVLLYADDRCVPFEGTLYYDDAECSHAVAAKADDELNKPPKYVIADGNFWTLGDNILIKDVYQKIQNKCTFFPVTIYAQKVFQKVSFSHFGEI